MGQYKNAVNTSANFEHKKTEKSITTIISTA
jgi:hypothetical protein